MKNPPPKIRYTCPGCSKEQDDIYISQALLYSENEPHYSCYQCPVCDCELGYKILKDCGAIHSLHTKKKTFMLTVSPNGHAAGFLNAEGKIFDLIGDIFLGLVQASSEEDAISQSLIYLPDGIVEPEWIGNPTLSGVEAFELA